ncbi:MAG TPA: hypothetical protein VG271_09445 [Beijerinckiaceae bacterium]|jgi:hypothetical protein|nr:hypothetical protein [Beijerinckiaceae bacterium]
MENAAMSSNPIFDFFEFSNAAMNLAWEAQEVVCMRVHQFARGDGTLTEAVTMVSEKVTVFMDAHVAGGLAVALGHPASGPINALRCYGDRVSANKLRLSQIY